jgi:hypothetical protein
LPEPERQTTLAKALNAANNICFETVRAESLAALAPILPEPLLVQGFSAALQIGSERYRRDALLAFTPRLPEPNRSIALAELLSACQAIDTEPDRSSTVLAIVSHRTSLSRDEQTQCWRDCLRGLASQGRKPILNAQEPLLRLLQRLPGTDASAEVVEIAHAIRDVGRWFP